MDKNEKTAKENARLLAEKAAAVLDSKKGVGITLIELSDETIITDYFVIAAGTSSTHVKTLADEVKYKLSLEGITPAHTEGTNHSGWMLLDYGSVIVHVFTKVAREFYKLERLWDAGKVLPFEPAAE